jgi:hypothetical protein
MVLSGCVWLACLSYVGNWDGWFGGGEVLASSRLRGAFDWKLLCRSLFGCFVELASTVGVNVGICSRGLARLEQKT